MNWAFMWAWPPFTGSDVAWLRTAAGQASAAAEQLRRDPRMPKTAAWALGVCMLPVPGPFDNIAAAIITVILLLWPRTRRALLDAWPAPTHHHRKAQS